MASFKKNLASIYAVNILNGVMGVVLIPLSLRFLGAEGYGLFSIYSVIASFVALLDIGLGKSLQRALSISKNKKSYDEKIESASGAYLLIMAAVIIVLPALLFLLPAYVFPVEERLVPSLRWIVSLACIEYFLFIPLAINQSICFANEAFDKHAKFSLLSGIVRYAILFAAIYFCTSIVMVVGIYVMRRVVDQYLSQMIMGRLPIAVWRPSFRLASFRELGAHAVGLSITRLLQTILISMGSVLVNRSFGLESLGYFRAAFDLASKVWFVSNGLGLIIYPKLVKAFAAKSENRRVFMRLRHAMAISWVVFMIVGSVAAALSSVVLPQLRISDGTIISLFVPLVLGVCINAHANLGYEVIQAAGRYRLLNILSVIAIVMMVALFVILMPTMGLAAIAWSWLFSQLTYAVLTDMAALDAIALSVREHTRSILLRAASIGLSLLCLFAVNGSSSTTTFAVAFIFQVIGLLWCLSSFKNESAELSDV